MTNSRSPGRVRIDLLGPVRLRVDDVDLARGGPKLRGIVAVLALAGGRIVSVNDVLESVWGDDLPGTARNTLQYHIGVLRKNLAAHDAASCLVTREPGYGLLAETDVAQFLARAAQGARARTAGDHENAAAVFADALNQWRGKALADLRDFEFAEARAVALENQRLVCLESWADAELACGRAEGLIPPLQELVAENPTRERLWEQLMIALYRTGRQDAALAAYRSARTSLQRMLGVEPSVRLDAVQQAILRHDAKLAPTPAIRSRPARILTQTTLLTPESARSAAMLAGPGGTIIELGRVPVVLGRHADCDLVLSDDQASRRHARVELGPSGYMVVDLGSTNGTFVNGVRVDETAPLVHGDRIEVGHLSLRYIAPPGIR